MLEHKETVTAARTSHSLMAAAPLVPKPRLPAGDSGGGGSCCGCARLPAVGVPLLLTRCAALLSAALSMLLMWL